MAITTLTPGVYIDEISTLPPSVAPVATAIPAFIGYTANHTPNAFKPTRITSLPEFVSIFGGAALETFIATVTDTYSAPTITSRTISISQSTTSKFNLYYSLQLYFANGGGPCWIVSIGSNASGTPTLVDYTGAGKGLEAIEKIDEPTLLVFPDAINMAFSGGKPVDYGAVIQAALAQCNKLQDRFVISDVPTDGTSDVADYKDTIGTGNLKYGATYMPYLKTVFNYAINEAAANSVVHSPGGGPVDLDGTIANLNNPRPALILAGKYQPALYNQIIAKINEFVVTLPPSGAIAGIYASVDRDRGVWKAPANISVNAISGPVTIITSSEQADLNVDAGSGKSINAIRPFTGKGTLVWGARTLAGNDNEWRYVNVRRLFIFAEESIKKASEFVVFEPNDANTWERVRGLISNFLTNLWRDGALVGPTPAQAFFVKIGLGETMTPQDILEGKLIVEVGMAASRPAEFIILKFSHKLQEA